MITKIKQWDRNHYMTLGNVLYHPPVTIMNPLNIEEKYLMWLHTEPNLSNLTELEVRIYALLSHENVHSIQQGKGFKKWFWILKYLLSPTFKMNMEKEAYENQIKILKRGKVWRDREDRMFFVNLLSGELYGHSIDRFVAEKWIDSI